MIGPMFTPDSAVSHSSSQTIQRVGALILLVLAAVILASCGGTETPSPSDSTDSANQGPIEHVEGQVTLGDGTITVTPASGEALTLTLGPEIAVSEVNALATAKTSARVYYQGEDDPVAIQIQRSPAKPKGAHTTTGLVTEATETTLTIEDSSRPEPVLLSIKPEDAPKFETEHLNEHKKLGEPITVIYTTENGTDYAYSYSDA
jgi:hypothetical protein